MNVSSGIKQSDWVALSATFLRSIDVNALKGWPTRYDLGKGIVTDIIDGWLATVDFESGQRTINVCNLIHVKDIYLDAMKAEHNR